MIEPIEEEFKINKNEDKLGLSCAKLRFSCAGQLSFDGQKGRNIIRLNLETVDSFNYWNSQTLKPLAHLNL